MTEPPDDVGQYREGDWVFAETINTDTAASGTITGTMGGVLTFVDEVGIEHTTRPDMIMKYRPHGGQRSFPAI